MENMIFVQTKSKITNKPSSYNFYFYLFSIFFPSQKIRTIRPFKFRSINVGKMADHRTGIERAIKSREDKKEDYVLRKDRAITIYVISVQFAFKAFTINREQEGQVGYTVSFQKKDGPYVSFVDAIKLSSWQLYLEFYLTNDYVTLEAIGGSFLYILNARTCTQ